MRRYNVIDYYDVWGNCRDGYQVNNQRLVGTIELSDYPSDEDFINAAIELGILRQGIALGDVIVEDHGTGVDILDPDPEDSIEYLNTDNMDNEGKEPLPICGFWETDY